MLKVSNLSVSYGDLKIVSDVSFSLSEGDWLMLAGPNGAGKSTILGAIGGGIPCRGAVTWDGRSLLTMKGKERAALLGTLRQNHFVSYGFTVSQVVRLGRYAFGHNDPEGPRAVEEALLFPDAAVIIGDGFAVVFGEPMPGGRGKYLLAEKERP